MISPISFQSGVMKLKVGRHYARKAYSRNFLIIHSTDQCTIQISSAFNYTTVWKTRSSNTIKADEFQINPLCCLSKK